MSDMKTSDLIPTTMDNFDVSPLTGKFFVVEEHEDGKQVIHGKFSGREALEYAVERVNAARDNDIESVYIQNECGWNSWHVWTSRICDLFVVRGAMPFAVYEKRVAMSLIKNEDIVDWTREILDAPVSSHQNKDFEKELGVFVDDQFNIYDPSTDDQKGQKEDWEFDVLIDWE